MAMSLRTLLNPFVHADHKLAGLLYILLEIAYIYGIFFAPSTFDSRAAWYFGAHLTSCLVTLGALRNFRQLAKTNRNHGMFKDGRTFSVSKQLPHIRPLRYP